MKYRLLPIIALISLAACCTKPDSGTENKVPDETVPAAVSVPAFAKEWFYPADVTDIDAGGNCYYHDVYFGAIEASYKLEP